MKSVGEFWFRIGLGAVLIVLALLVGTGGQPEVALLLLIGGLVTVVWAVLSALLIIRKARKIERNR